MMMKKKTREKNMKEEAEKLTEKEKTFVF